MMKNDVVRLYEAALKGSVATLNTLIQKDQLILFRVSLTSLSETPLHISAMLGHLDFVRALLSQKPDLAAQLDSLRHSPLHLASAEGHTEIVKALLGVNKDVCLVRDQDGRIPLHLAAMRGRVEVIQELINARPESARVVLDREETVLHLCAKYNQLEALKLLVQLVNDDELLINSINQDGNTILHMAVMQKQSETIRFLLSKPEVKAIANTLNGNGFTILDIIEHSPRDFKSCEIRDILMETGAERAKTATHPSPPTVTNSEAQSAKSWFLKFIDYYFVDPDALFGWFQNSQGPFMTVATLIATVAFQGAISPPGGVLQDTVSVNNSTCNPNFTKINKYLQINKKRNITECVAGTAVFAYSNPDAFYDFMNSNSLSFYASLYVILMIISGFPLNKPIFMFCLTYIMSLSVFFMSRTFFMAIRLVTPGFFHPGRLLNPGFYTAKSDPVVVYSVIYYMSLHDCSFDAHFSIFHCIKI